MSEADKDSPEQRAKPEKIDSDAASNSTVHISAEKAYYLQRTQVLGDVQNELIRWGKKRFWIIATIVVAVGILGSGVLIRETVRILVEKQIEEANKAAILANAAATRATIFSEESTKQLQSIGKTVTVLQDKANQVDAQFVGIGQRLEAENANARANVTREAKDLGVRLSRLESLVSGLAKQPKITQATVSAYEKEIANLKAAAIAEKQRFTENSTYYVTVYYNKNTAALATKVTNILSQNGFKSSAETLSMPVRHTVDLATGLPVMVPAAEINTNRIIYTYEMILGNEWKAKEIVDTLRPIVRFTEVRAASSDEATTFLSISLWRPIVLPNKLIAIFIVEKA